MTIDDALPTATDLFGEDLGGGPSARAWFLGDAPAPQEEPTDDAGRAAMAAEVAQLPFLRVVRHLLEFVGEGCRLTKAGALFAVDRRRVEERCVDMSEGWAWYAHGTVWRVREAYELLTRHHWLVREEGWVRPTGRPLCTGGSETASAEGLDGTRRLLAAAVLGGMSPAYGDLATVDGWEGDVLDALAVATGPDGLILPDHPRDGTLIHCVESIDFLVGLLRHPHVRDVPLDRADGHVADSAVRRLARTADAMERLVSVGVLTCESDGTDFGEGAVVDGFVGTYARAAPRRGRLRRYRAPVLMRGALALVRAGRVG